MRVISHESIEIVSVSDALRRHFGRFTVKGTLTSMTKLFKMITGVSFYCDKCTKLTETHLPKPAVKIKSEDRKCSECGSMINNVNYDYCNAVTAELQDLEAFNDLERLPVFLFDKDTENIRVGENVVIDGQIQINESDGKKLLPYFYSESVKYAKNNSISLTDLDIEAIKRFTNRHGSKIIDELIFMFDKSIIGCEYVKRGLLLSAVNSNADNNNSNSRRERINSLLIGEPGLGKSKLLKSVISLVPKSRYESGAKFSSGKSLTAIVAKEEDNYVLRLGPLPLAKNALCCINEFGRMAYEDQSHFLDVMEEGEFSINKYGVNARIKATTTIIASANPINNSTWQDNEKIDLNEIPALNPIIDRFDLIFVFRNTKNEDEIRSYAYRKSGFESNNMPNYSNYIIKHLEYAKRFNPLISEEAQQILNEYFIKIMLQDDFGSNRILDTLFRLCKAFARLKLKNVVDVDDAKDTIQFYNVVLQQFQRVVNVPCNPRDLTFNECLEILKNSRTYFTLEELVKQACHNNQYIERYVCFGNKPLRLRDNIKVRGVYEMLLNHPNIRRVQEKPVVLQWRCDGCVPCDTRRNTSSEDIKEKLSPQIPKINNASNSNLKVPTVENAVSLTTHGSHRNDINSNAGYPPDCYYCDEVFDGIGKQGYDRHMIQKHANKPGYPGKADIELHSLMTKGMPWEV